MTVFSGSSASSGAASRCSCRRGAAWRRRRSTCGTLAPRINTAFYHGGEPIRILRPFLEGGEQKPYFLAMTAAGQSALNVRGLDTVVIDDVKFFNVIDRGRNVLTQEHLGANEILQMAGRVHGRVEGGRVFILSDRDIEFSSARSRRSRSSSSPAIRSAWRSRARRSACARTSSICRFRSTSMAYRNAMALLEERGIVEHGRLTRYGRAVEAMPVERAWAELLVNADDELVPYLAVMSSVESLHRMTREERDLDGLIVPGSDHLTAYNLYADAYNVAGRHGERVRAAAPPVRRGAHRAVGRAPRRAREVDRGRGAGDGEHLSRRRHAAAAADDACARRNAARVSATARSVHAVHARDRRANGDGRRSARVEDERVRQLGPDHRVDSATSPTSSAIRARRSRARRFRTPSFGRSPA